MGGIVRPRAEAQDAGLQTLSRAAIDVLVCACSKHHGDTILKMEGCLVCLVGGDIDREDWRAKSREWV